MTLLSTFCQSVKKHCDCNSFYACCNNFLNDVFMRSFLKLSDSLLKLFLLRSHSLLLALLLLLHPVRVMMEILKILTRTK